MVHIFTGWSCSLLISCVPPQLWFHPSYSLRGQWPHGCLGYYAGMHISLQISKFHSFLSLHACVFGNYTCMLESTQCHLIGLFVQGIQTWLELTFVRLCRPVYFNSLLYLHTYSHVHICLYMTDELNPTNGLQNNGLIVESCKPAWYISALQILTGASSSWMLSSG